MKIPKGVTGTTVDEVFFTESSVRSAMVLKHLRVDIFHQNANLLEVKRRLAEQARSAGGNAVVNFHYGQRVRDWKTVLLSMQWDTEEWYGEGDVVAL